MGAILSGEGKSGKAVTVLLVLLNCGMLVIDSVTFLCTLSACFSLSSAFAFVPKLLLLPREKKTTQLCFSTVSPFDNL